MENNYLIDSDNLSPEALERKHRLENDPSLRTNHMEYLPGMQKIESDVCKNVLEQMNSYDHSKYTAKDVMRALEHETCSIEDFKALLSPAAEPFLEKMAQKVADNLAVPCSECGYCIDACPEMIPIPEYFNLYNRSKNQPESNIYRLYFDKLGDEKVGADECTYCGTCLDYCTQKIDISEKLEKVIEHFQEGFTPYS